MAENITIIITEVRGAAGAKGDNFDIDETGLLSELSLYDAELKGFSFLATDTGQVFFKNTDVSGDWSDPVQWGLNESQSGILAELEASKQGENLFIPETQNTYLRDDGTFKEISSSVGGFANNLFISNIDSDVPGYKTLTYTPDVVETLVSDTVIVGDNNKLIETYLYPGAVAETLYPAGLWSFSVYARVSNANGDTQIGIEYFSRTTGGVETTLFTAWSEPIDNLTNQIIIFPPVIESSFSVNETDKMGARIYFKTSSSSTKTIYYMIGGIHATYISTPNRIRHSTLRAVNEDPEVQHMTALEKAMLDSFTVEGGNIYVDI